MDKAPQVLDFIKAVSEPDRLRVIGVLSQRPATIREVATLLDMPFREAFKHLGMLEFVGVAHKTGDVFTLDTDALEKLSKQQFGEQRPSPVPALPDMDPKSRRVLETFLKPDAQLRQLPAQASKLQLVLEHVVTFFEPGRQYTEKEVNAILRDLYADTASLRRSLIDARLLDREGDGSRYWRVPKPSGKN
jgi:hypothetical protein